MEATNCGITNSMDMSLSKLRKIVKDREAQCAVIHGVAKIGHDWATEQQQPTAYYFQNYSYP